MTLGRAMKADTSPRLDPLKVYPDVGCEFSPTCLTCPLPVCRYDMSAAQVLSIKKQLKADSPSS